MDNKKTFIVGDIHGCSNMLKDLVDKIEWNPNSDSLIFIGDYIDRGDDAKGVVDYILELKERSSRVQCLLGNHEQIFQDYLSGINTEVFLINGGSSTLRSYENERDNDNSPLIPSDHLEFFSSLLPVIELEEYYIVHAGFRPYVPVKDQSLLDMLWIRDEFILSTYDFGKKIIFGHTPFNEPLIMKNKIGIDTGAVYGNRLTCIELPGVNFYSVDFTQ